MANETESQCQSRKRLFSQRTSSSSSGSQYTANFQSKFLALVEELSALQSDVLDPSTKRQAESMVFVAKQQIARNKIAKETLGKIVISHSQLPLEFLWMLQSAEVLNFSLYIALHSDQNLVSLAGRLAQGLDCSSKENTQGNSISHVSIDFLRTCITLVHGPDPPTILNPVRKSCRTLLTLIFKKAAFQLDDEDLTVPWWLSKVAQEMSQKILQHLVENLLEVQLTAPPLISVHQALARQAEWKSGRKSFDFLFQSCGSSTLALNALVKVLNDTREVNWKAVLISVSSFLKLFPDARDKLTDLISAWLTQSLANEDTETLLLSFILARQLGHSCPPAPYASWFKKCFGHRPTTLCKSNQQFKFLLEFLTQLVPHEPLPCLKAHHDLPPYIPVALKEKLQDFLMIASARLRDLAPVQDVGIFPADGEMRSIVEQVEHDVEKAISSFKMNNKVPEAIMTATIFKKKYFESHFLPALLTPREGIASNDPQIRLVDSLLKAKKISAAQFENFQAKCLEKM